MQDYVRVAELHVRRHGRTQWPRDLQAAERDAETRYVRARLRCLFAVLMTMMCTGSEKAPLDAVDVGSGIGADAALRIDASHKSQPR